MEQSFSASLARVGIVLISLVLSLGPPRVCRAATGQNTHVQIISDARGLKSTVTSLVADLDAVEGISVVRPDGPAPDVIVELRSARGPDGLQHTLTAFDSSTGERLQDIKLPGVIGQVLNEAIVDGVRQAIDRRNHPAGATQFLGMLSVRNIDLGSAYDQQVEQLGQEVERELFKDRSVAILERSELCLLNEAAPVQNRPAGPKLLAASTLIEIDVAKLPASNAGQVQVTALLSGPAGEKQGQAGASGSLDDIATLALALAGDVEKTISQLPPASRSGAADADEATRFADESKSAFARHHWIAAANAADAALALAPAAKEYRTLLAAALMRAGVNSINPTTVADVLILELRPPDLDWDRTLKTILRASNLLLNSGDDPSALETLADTAALLHRFSIAMLEAPPPLGSNVRGLRRPDEQGQFHSPEVPLTADQCSLLTKIILNDRDYLQKVVLPQRLAAVRDNASFEAYTTSLMESLGEDCHIFCKTDSEYVQTATRQLIDWAPLAGKYALPRMDVYGLSAMEFDSAPAIWVQHYHDWANGWRPPCFAAVTPEQAREWEKVADALEQAGAPMRLYINLRNWAREVEHPAPIVDIAPAPPAASTNDAPPNSTAADRPETEKALPLLYSKSVAMIDSQAGQVDPYCINKPLIVGDQLFVVALGDAMDGGNELRLMRGTIDASAPLKIVSRLSHVSDDFVKSCRQDGNSFFQMTRFLGSGHLILSSDTGLIFVLSLGDGGEAIIDAQKDLPGSTLQSAADLGDVIYMVVSDREGATCMLSYDLHTRQVQTLFSSSRSNTVAPFDNLAPMSMSWMWSDPDHSRIVFFAYQSTWDAKAKGLWEYSAKTTQFRKLLPTTYARKEDGAGYELTGTPVVDHKFMLLTGQRLIYDLSTDAPTELVPRAFSQFKGRYEWPTIFHRWWKQFGNPGGSGVGSGDNTIQRRTGGIHALSELWQGAYPMFAIDVPPTQLLVADWSGIWLLTPN